jgi:hypothetical protein
LNRRLRTVLARTGLVATVLIVLSSATGALSVPKAGVCEERCDGGAPADLGCSPSCIGCSCPNNPPATTAASLVLAPPTPANPRGAWNALEPILSAPADGVFHPPTT